MSSSGSSYAIGQAVFIKTDTLDYSEECIPFRDMGEMVKICSEAHENLTLEKVIVYSMVSGEPIALQLGFVASSRGQRPAHLAAIEDAA